VNVKAVGLTINNYDVSTVHVIQGRTISNLEHDPLTGRDFECRVSIWHSDGEVRKEMKVLRLVYGPVGTPTV
jgi:hypothetical protein